MDGQQPKETAAQAMKRILEQKKNAQREAQDGKGGFSTNAKPMKSQIHKVQNNQRRRTGV